MEQAKNKDWRLGANLRRQWQQHLKAWWPSGDTQVSYCRRHGLSRDAFQCWKHNLEGGRSKGFVELPRCAAPQPGGVVETLMDEPVRVRVPQGVSPEQFRTVLQAVKERWDACRLERRTNLHAPRAHGLEGTDQQPGGDGSGGDGAGVVFRKPVCVLQHDPEELEGAVLGPNRLFALALM
jgi:hypothetical protein